MILLFSLSFCGQFLMHLISFRVQTASFRVVLPMYSVDIVAGTDIMYHKVFGWPHD